MMIESPRLILRNWQEEEREIFYRLNSDQQVMAFFPSPRSRQESDRLFDSNCDNLGKAGFGFYALEEKSSHTIVGAVLLLQTDLEPYITKSTVEIGWRLLPEYWGRGYATEAARTLITYGFNRLKLAEIVSFAVWNNTRSIAVMRRLGMVEDKQGGFDHPDVPDRTPHLKRHVLFRFIKTV